MAENYPEQLGVRLRRGARARIDAVVEAAGGDRGQWARDAVMRALETAERTQRRQRAAS